MSVKQEGSAGRPSDRIGGRVEVFVKHFQRGVDLTSVETLETMNRYY